MKCVHYAESETKAQSNQLELAAIPPSKKFKLPPSDGKFMLDAFWDSSGIILARFMRKGRTATAGYYSEVILKKKTTTKKKKTNKKKN